MKTASPEAANTFLLVKEGVTDFCILLLDTEGKITSWNAGAERLFGYTEAEVLGQYFAIIFTVEDVAKGQPEAEMKTAAANRSADDERLLRRRDGSHFMASGVLTALRDDEGVLRGFVKVLRDITDRLRRDRLLEQARQHERLAVLAGGFAHDFNNLLTAILGNASYVMDQVPLGSPIREPLREVVESSTRAADLTKRLLAYAGRGQFLSQPFHLSRLVEELKPSLQKAVRGMELRYDLAGELPELRGDEVQIEQAIVDLTINAAEAMAKRPGTILISTGQAQLGWKELEALGAEDAKEGRFVYCEVADEGVGMDERTHGRMLEPFFSTKFLGRGLGLSSAWGIVRKHGGAIRVESELGVGTRARIFLPVLGK